MPSTRKVVPKRSTATKSKKAASSKSTTSKTKKVKTASKKTSKKTAKKSTKKTASKKKKPLPKPDSKNVKFLPKLPTSITLRSSLSLSALTPYRFPLPLDGIALGSLRAVGVAIFLLLIAGGLLVSGPTIETIVSNLEDSNTYAQLFASAEVDPSRFVFNDSQFYVGPVTPGAERIVRVTSTNQVEKVVLVVTDALTGSYMDFVEMTKESTNENASVWRGTWAVSRLPAGSYQLTALMIIESVGYEFAADQTYAVGFTSAQ